MKIVALPRDNTALLRDPEEVPERLRRPVMAKSEALFAEHPELRAILGGIADAEADEAALELIGALVPMSELNDLVVLAFVKKWSFKDDDDADLPVCLENLLDLPGDCYDALREITAPLFGRMMEMANTLSPDGVADRLSPTGP